MGVSGMRHITCTSTEWLGAVTGSTDSLTGPRLRVRDARVGIDVRDSDDTLAAADTRLWAHGNAPRRWQP